MIRVVRDPYRIGKRDVGIGVSVGIALAPADGLDAETLIARADKALYLAKSRGRGCLVFCDEAAPREESALVPGKDQSGPSLSEAKGFSVAKGFSEAVG
ncbi:MAG: diguanylate cyclase domain-containing protein [Hyphomicrobiales bacterium]